MDMIERAAEELLLRIEGEEAVDGVKESRDNTAHFIYTQNNTRQSNIMKKEKPKAGVVFEKRNMIRHEKDKLSHYSG